MNRPHTLASLITVSEDGIIKSHLSDALLDTGANISAVSLDILDNLGAYKTNNKITVYGSVGSTICNIYQIYIDIGLSDPIKMEVVGIDRSKSMYKILLGVDLIHKIFFQIDKGKLYLDM